MENTKEKNEVLELRSRDNHKSRAVRKSEGVVYGVVYGSGVEGSVSVEMSASELVDVLKKNARTSVLPIKLDGKKLNAIVKEIQKDNLNPGIIHIDFQSVKKNEVLEMELPLVIKGEENIIRNRLIVNQPVTTVKVKGPADLIPDNLEIDVENLKNEDKILVSDLKLPNKIEMLSDKDELVLSIAESKTEAQAEADEAAAAENAETEESVEPEVVEKEEDK